MTEVTPGVRMYMCVYISLSLPSSRPIPMLCHILSASPSVYLQLDVIIDVYFVAGEIPRSFGELVLLRTMRLGCNRLSGEYP